MTTPLRMLTILVIACIGMLRTDAFADAPGPKARTSQPPEAWTRYWRMHNVSPPPPRNFKEGEFKGRVLNLTDGHLSDVNDRILGPVWFHTGGYNCSSDSPKVEASVCARLKL